MFSATTALPVPSHPAATRSFFPLRRLAEAWSHLRWEEEAREPVVACVQFVLGAGVLGLLVGMGQLF